MRVHATSYVVSPETWARHSRLGVNIYDLNHTIEFGGEVLMVLNLKPRARRLCNYIRDELFNTLQLPLKKRQWSRNKVQI